MGRWSQTRRRGGGDGPLVCLAPLMAHIVDANHVDVTFSGPISPNDLIVGDTESEDSGQNDDGIVAQSTTVLRYHYPASIIGDDRWTIGDLGRPPICDDFSVPYT
jgi:hypothetical protein